MEIKRKFEDVEIIFNISDEELINLISKKPIDERIVFFRKLFNSDLTLIRKNFLSFFT